MILYMYVAQGQGLTTPWGWNFDVNRNILSLRSFVASLKEISLNVLSLYSFVTSFKKMSLKPDFIHFLHDLIHEYSPGAGTESPQGTKFWCQQEGLITLPICCKFQRNLFEVWFYTFFFMILYMYIVPGLEHTAPQGTKFWCQQKLLVTSVICCQFQIIESTIVSEKATVLPFSHTKA